MSGVIALLALALYYNFSVEPLGWSWLGIVCVILCDCISDYELRKLAK